MFRTASGVDCCVWPQRRRRAALLLCIPLLACSGPVFESRGPIALPRLEVSESGRFLTTSDGRPFLYLADTAWGLFHKTDREDAALYLHDRSQKRFTVVQASLTAAGFWPGLEPNRRGHPPFENRDPRLPNEEFFAYVDWILDTAQELGLYVGLLPTWGEYVCPGWQDGPKIFDTENAYVYGRWLAQRYGERSNLIWILGGDRRPGRCGEEDKEIWLALARGLTEGPETSTPLITYHPRGGTHSSWDFHHEPWLDFNLLQSSHCRNMPVYDMVAVDYALEPVKPVLDGEPVYENIPSCLDLGESRISAWDTRKAAYWSVFAGAAGHAYGAAEVFSFWQPGEDNPKGWFQHPWKEALDYAGADQMQHLRALMESRPYLTRIPDSSALITDRGAGDRHLQLTRSADGSYLMLYFSSGRTARVRTDALRPGLLRGYWYDPRDGSAHEISDIVRSPILEFTPPSDEDWVLVLDLASSAFPPPGQSILGQSGR